MRLSIILILPILLYNGCTWEDQYYLWTNRPEPYGGVDALNIIKTAKDNNATMLKVDRRNITDITPLAGLTNLDFLSIYNNNISDSQKAMLEEALPNTKILW